MDGNESDTTILIERSLTGDAVAFEALLDRCANRLLLFLRRNGGRALGADADEEDLVQIVVERAWARLPEFKSRGTGSFYAWLVTMARSAISDRLKYLEAKGRGAARHIESAVGSSASRGGPIDGSTTATRILARNEEVEMMSRALHRLPDDERQIVEWHVLEEKPLQAIANDLGISKTSAWNRLQAGIGRLRTSLYPAP